VSEVRLSVEAVQQLWLAGLIERARLRGRRTDRWRPGQKLKLLFVGYNGNRNTGSDVRVQEMLRQVRHVLGDKNLDASVVTYHPSLSRGYFRPVRQVVIPARFPGFLAQEIEMQHGMVACEGSMFKSNFGNSLPTLMAGALGIAAAQGKLAIGYGAEAGKMDWLVSRLVSRYCREAFIITRNAESQKVLRERGIASELGTDTAWTFEPHPPATAEALLSKAGWDGKQKVLGICPMNPFWWPLTASLSKRLMMRAFGAFRESHARGNYFHRGGAEVKRKFEQYLDALAAAVRAFRGRHEVFPIVIGMEALDAPACRALSERLGGAPVFPSLEHDMFTLVALLRRCDLIVSSRYHAVVTSMPGLVPSGAISMDERLRNLFDDRGQSELLVEVSDPELAGRLEAILERLLREREAIQDGIGHSVARNLGLLASMGRTFAGQVARAHPEFPLPSLGSSPLAYLPPISPGLSALLERTGAFATRTVRG
jgi:polysaccharide pyruvyl transferase WcaK-like protein